MKRVIFYFLVLSFVICHLSFVCAMGGPAPQKQAGGGAGSVLGPQNGNYLIDNFESGSLKQPREWWTFDINKAEVAPNSALKMGDEKVAAEVGNYSLLLSGPVKNWYAGGCGTYLAKEKQDLTKYNAFQADIYGNGPGSGTIKVELIDDDNNNWQVEQDPNKSYAPIYDDRFVYEIRVDWNGWKRVNIPFADFTDDNPGVGDDVWNPQQTGASGGLLQTQFICIGSTDKGTVNYNVDNVMLTTSER
jgi:hypothetical protein